MNLRQPIVFAMMILFLGFATVAAYQAFAIAGIIILLLLVLLLAVALYISFRKGALVDEMEVGVIFNRFNNSFIRFAVGPDPDSVRHHNAHHAPNWIPFGRTLLAINDPHYVRLKWYEEVRGRIPKKSQTAKGELKSVRTADGIPVTISWKVSYTVDVSLITPKIRYKMARTLPENSEKVIAGKTEQALKHLIELRTIQSLYGLGALQALEQELCQRVDRQLTQPVNLGFQTLKPKDIALGHWLQVKGLRQLSRAMIQTQMPRFFAFVSQHPSRYSGLPNTLAESGHRLAQWL
ncbi:MAG: hypothetical protein IPM53_33045 [Anaerolineaceae bacterium]|nr:hypothetical protein [Anaerolineaceae bacterium]